MSRERQRANRKLKEYMEANDGRLPENASFIRARTSPPTVKKKPWLNHEGYHDPTAYAAIYGKGRS